MTRDVDCDERLRRRSEPGKRDRIIDVTLDLIVEHGAAGATYRTAAEAAGVPLGSMTHRFPSRESRLLSAFTRLTDEGFSPLDHGLASEAAGAVEALTDIVISDDGCRHRVLLAE